MNLPPFGSDNYAPVSPEVLAALAEVNTGYAVAYGDDDVTARFGQCAQRLFGAGARAFPVINGTGANVISLMAASPRWGGVVAADTAHAHTDENGAPERVGGLKMLTRPAVDGRISVDDVLSWGAERGDEHRAQPSVLTITQATELGTSYRPEHLRELADAARSLGMAVHIDGSRLANAAAFLGCSLGAITTDVGADVLSLGAAKNGGMIGEAIVVMAPDAAPTEESAQIRKQMIDAIPYLRKFTTQLASKQRYVSAQLLAMFDDAAPSTPGAPAADPLWLRNARSANAAAARLRAGVEALGGNVVRPSRPTEANAVFATLPRDASDRLRARAGFYGWANGETPERVEVRWMCSWATTDADVDGFLAALAESL